MAYPSNHGFCKHSTLRIILVLGGFSLVVLILGKPFNWQLKQNSTAQQSPCPSCDCDCPLRNILYLPLELFHQSYSDCGKFNPDMNKEMEKDAITFLSEELSLLQNVTHESLETSKALIMNAKRTSSQYQKEAEKCSAGTEVCEEARETAEAELIAERKLSAVWQKRALELGWKDSRKVSLAHKTHFPPIYI